MTCEVMTLPRGGKVLKIDDARIVYRNFRGEGNKFNREGERNFRVVIEDPLMAEQLAELGLNVKIKEPREEGEPPFMHFPVKINFKGRPVNIYLVANGRVTQLDEESVACLDNAYITRVDMDLNLSSWEVQDKVGVSAYLSALRVEHTVNRFADEFDR